MPRTSDGQASGNNEDRTSLIPLNSATNWTITNRGGGVGSINTNGQYFNVDIPTGATNPSGSRAIYNLAASLVPDFTLRTLEIIAKIKSATNTNSSSRIEFFLSGTAGAGPTVIISVWGDGTIETAWTNTSGSFSSFGWSAPATISLTGNSWLRLSISGSVANYYWGTGSTQPTQWKILTSRPLPCALTGENPITTLIVGGLHLASPSSDINIQLSNISVTTI